MRANNQTQAQHCLPGTPGRLLLATEPRAPADTCPPNPTDETETHILTCPPRRQAAIHFPASRKLDRAQGRRGAQRLPLTTEHGPRLRSQLTVRNVLPCPFAPFLDGMTSWGLGRAKFCHRDHLQQIHNVSSGQISIRSQNIVICWMTHQ